MKKKLLLSILSGTMCVATISAVIAMNNSDIHLGRDTAVSGTFVLDDNSVQVEDDHYIAIALDDSQNTVAAKFVGMHLDDASHKLQFGQKSIGWFTNIDPVRGFDSLTLSFDSYIQGFGAAYFSYNELNVDDIFAGKYQDIFCVPFNSSNNFNKLLLNSNDFPQLLEARYALFLMQNTSESALGIKAVSFDSHCDVEPAEQEIGTVTNYRQEYLDALEDEGIELWSGFILSNGSYTLSPLTASQYMPYSGYEIVTIQNMNGWADIGASLMAPGFETTYMVQEDGVTMALFQKKDENNPNLVYTYMLTIMPATYIFADIVCTTDIPYYQQDTEWPVDKIIDGGAPSDLVAAFNPFNLPNVTYMFAGMYDSIRSTQYIVAISPTSEFNVDDFYAAINAYVAYYEADSGYSVNVFESGSGFSITQLSTNYEFQFAYSGSNMSVQLVKYNTYDHLPLAELRTMYSEYIHDIIPTDISLSGTFVSNTYYGSTTFIGSNITPSMMQTFINEFINKGFIFAGTYKNGQLISSSERMALYNDRFDFYFEMVDYNKYSFTFNIGNSSYGKRTISDMLNNFTYGYNAASQIISVALNSESPLLDQSILSYDGGVGEFGSTSCIIKGASETAISDFLAMFEDEKLQVSNVRGKQYKITLVDSLDEKLIGSSIYFQFDTFFVGEYRNVVIYYTGDTFDLDYSYNYNQVNSHVSSEVGCIYVSLSSSSYKFFRSDNGFSTLGTLEEMTTLYRQYINSIKAKGIYTYDEYTESYVTSDGKLVHIELCGYSNSLFRLDVYYSEKKDSRVFYSYDASGLSSCSFINDNFAELPHLSGERVYKIISETENEVQIAVNNEFDLHNYYVSVVLRNNGFSGSIKRVGDVIYSFDSTTRSWGMHTVFTFKRTVLQTLDVLNTRLGSSIATRLNEVLELSNEWLYLYVSSYEEEDRGSASFYIYCDSYNEVEDHFNSLGIHSHEPFIRGNYRYTLGYYRAESSVFISISWELISE